MTEQPTVVVETPKRRIALRRPTLATVKKVGALAGAFTLGAVVGVRKAKSECACESDTPEQPATDN